MVKNKTWWERAKRKKLQKVPIPELRKEAQETEPEKGRKKNG